MEPSGRRKSGAFLLDQLARSATCTRYGADCEAFRSWCPSGPEPGARGRAWSKGARPARARGAAVRTGGSSRSWHSFESSRKCGCASSASARKCSAWRRRSFRKIPPAGPASRAIIRRACPGSSRSCASRLPVRSVVRSRTARDRAACLERAAAPGRRAALPGRAIRVRSAPS